MKGDEFRPLREALERGEPQAVHETRKLSRQVGAELSLDGAPRKARRAWRDLRRAVAPLRDHDVTGEHITSALKRLKAPLPEIAQFEQAWAEKRQGLLADLHLPELPRVPERPGNFKKKARSALLKQSQRLQEDAATVLKASDSVVWHEWRKALKQYRYTHEVLAPAPKILKDTLDALGRMQDAEVVLDAVAHDWPHGHQEALIKQESGARNRARRTVQKLWPELNAHFQEVQSRQGKLGKKGKEPRPEQP
ncbi:CHAD domain-containing protein [Deinococcus cavernae]|uniref:CHAD domain-containing protein n=1 Tax=Deinococcus cavernae TaxID=2320857 RepID=A0A418V7W9_9DEIO|nr:CHAD domain-containing protein [Deinococcus cavernae]RJF72171.1 CHAD domain-containing protein [Deinococcus cavernae]